MFSWILVAAELKRQIKVKQHIRASAIQPNNYGLHKKGI